MMRSVLLSACLLLALPTLASADLPSWLRKQNGDIVDGNELLGRGDAKAALEAYDRAASELPNNPGVQLNRGLALLKLGELGKAKEALLSATGPGGSNDVRADAYRNLALSFFRDADALAGQQKHDEAQKAFRESVDAAKRSLRLRPGDPNTAWNLELAARRMREEEAKHKEQQEKEKQEQEKQDKQEGGEPQEGDESQDGSDKPQDGQDQPQKPEPPKQDPADDAKKQEQAKQEQQKQEQQKQKQKQANAGKDGKEAKEAKEGAAKEKALPADVAHALDALQDGEENFERVRARQRAQQERRAPEKDW